MKRLFFTGLCLVLLSLFANGQGFTTKQFNVAVKVNKDASLDITETIRVNFYEQKHGLFRTIPFKYPRMDMPRNEERGEGQIVSGGKTKTMIEDITVEGWDYSVSTQGDYKEVKIGNKDKYVEGDQEYIIHYQILGAINFFNDRSEFYLNLIGDRWSTAIEESNFSIELYEALPGIPRYFVATGSTGSRENHTDAMWHDNKIFSGKTTERLGYHEGMTAGIVFPKDYLIKPNYFLLHFRWMILPVLVFASCWLIWRKWGKDASITLQTEFYPPNGVSPSVAGYVIDDRLDRRDLTALIPYWGAGGYLKIREEESKSLGGLIKTKEYEFFKEKELPENAMDFEKTLFGGIFASGNRVKLSTLKNVLYKSMASAKAQLEKQVDKGDYYEKGSRGTGCWLNFLGTAAFIYGAFNIVITWGEPVWHGLAFLLSGLIVFFFGLYMPKKTVKGTDLYQKLAGFREFIQLVEKPKLEQFLKEDPNYFDKVLPYAIIFDVADHWKDKLKDLDVPPPNWYAGNYSNFTTYAFLNSLDTSMNKMTDSFYSAPSSSGSSGGSWSSGGGGGFSGGGFGGGGGGSW